MPPERRAIAGVADSKRLAAAERQRLERLIRRTALGIGIGAASVREIDRLNIYHATVLAMRRAIARLPVHPDHVIVDGRPVRALGRLHTAVVGGDDRCYAVACASIVAKVTRDRLMTALGGRYPAYAWERNAGYGTPDHLRGLALAGATPHHRRSFTPVYQLTLNLDGGAPEPGTLPDDAPAARPVLTAPDLVTRGLAVADCPAVSPACGLLPGRPTGDLSPRGGDDDDPRRARDPRDACSTPCDP